MFVFGGLWQGIDRSHSWVNSAYAPGGSRSVLRRNPNSSCDLKQVPNPSSPSSYLFTTKQHSGVIFCLHKLLSAFHVATPFYLWIPLIWLHHSSSHQQITAHICCGCLPHSCRSFTSLTLIVEFCGHPPIPVDPFSHHFVCVFTSPSHHVRQTTAAAIACLPSWTAWPCFQFPQGRLPRR